MQRIALFLFALGLARCATVVNDQRENIAVNSEPPGAVVSVECGAAPVYGGVTPANIIIERTADPCAVTIAKEGYAEQRVELQRKLSGAMMGNKVPGVVLGALFGLVMVLGDDPAGAEGGYEIGSALGEAPGNAIDRKTGAAYKHVPGKVFVRLDPAP